MISPWNIKPWEWMCFHVYPLMNNPEKRLNLEKSNCWLAVYQETWAGCWLCSSHLVTCTLFISDRSTVPVSCQGVLCPLGHVTQVAVDGGAVLWKDPRPSSSQECLLSGWKRSGVTSCRGPYKRPSCKLLTRIDRSLGTDCWRRDRLLC